jgi:hypothetical protein
MTWTEIYIKSSIMLLTIISATFFATAAHAVSQYDSDGFTIFPTKSSDYMSGYRAGVIQADKDITNFDKLGGIDARQDHIKCPPDSINADYCSGFKDGYSDEAMDQLE